MDRVYYLLLRSYYAQERRSRQTPKKRSERLRLKLLIGGRIFKRAMEDEVRHHGNKLNVLKANEFYYSITKNYPKNVTAGGYDGLENLHPDDREKAIKAFPYRSEMYSVKMLYGCRLKFSTLQAVKIVQFIMRLFRTAVNKWAF